MENLKGREVRRLVPAQYFTEEEVNSFEPLRKQASQLEAIERDRQRQRRDAAIKPPQGNRREPQRRESVQAVVGDARMATTRNDRTVNQNLPTQEYREDDPKLWQRLSVKHAPDELLLKDQCQPPGADTRTLDSLQQIRDRPTWLTDDAELCKQNATQPTAGGVEYTRWMQSLAKEVHPERGGAGWEKTAEKTLSKTQL